MFSKMLSILRRMFLWTETFKGAMTMAMLCFICTISDIHYGNYIMAWVMGFCTVIWLFKVGLSINRKPDTEEVTQLTEEQQARIDAAVRELQDAVNDIEREGRLKGNFKLRVKPTTTKEDNKEDNK